MTSDSPLISIFSDIFVPSQWIGRFSTVHSTVGEKFAAKVRNSLPRVANAELQKYLASATLCNTAKTSAKTLSRIRNPLRYPAELRAQLGEDIPSVVDRYIQGSRASTWCFFLRLGIRKVSKKCPSSLEGMARRMYGIEVNSRQWLRHPGSAIGNQLLWVTPPAAPSATKIQRRDRVQQEISGRGESRAGKGSHDG